VRSTLLKTNREAQRASDHRRITSPITKRESNHVNLCNSSHQCPCHRCGRRYSLEAGRDKSHIPYTNVFFQFCQIPNLKHLSETQAAAADALRTVQLATAEGTNTLVGDKRRLEWYALLSKELSEHKVCEPEQTKEFCERAGASLVGWHYSPWPGAVFTIVSDRSEYPDCVTVRDAAGGFFPLREQLAWGVAEPPISL
jgi:hypothetical protein